MRIPAMSPSHSVLDAESPSTHATSQPFKEANSFLDWKHSGPVKAHEMPGSNMAVRGSLYLGTSGPTHALASAALEKGL